jgi:hypothetical protein
MFQNAIQIAKTLLFKCNCTKSAFDKNLKAKANSRNPKTTFTVFNHPPVLCECNHPEHSKKQKWVRLMPMKTEHPIGAIPFRSGFNQ